MGEWMGWKWEAGGLRGDTLAMLGLVMFARGRQQLRTRLMRSHVSAKLDMANRKHAMTIQRPL